MPNNQIGSIEQVVAREQGVPAGNGQRATLGPVASASSSPAVKQEAFDAISQAPDPAALKKATEQINEFIKANSRNLQFSVDKGINRIIVKVVDQETGEVIRQIPAEETLAIAQSLGQAQGVVIRSKA